MPTGVRALYFEELNIGKRIKSSKKKFAWKLELDGLEFSVELYISSWSKKVKVIVNGDIKHSAQRTSGSTFSCPVRIRSHELVVVQLGDLFDLRIDNVSFHSLIESGGENRLTTNSFDRGATGNDAQSYSRDHSLKSHWGDFSKEDSRQNWDKGPWANEHFGIIKGKATEAEIDWELLAKPYVLCYSVQGCAGQMPVETDIEQSELQCTKPYQASSSLEPTAPKPPTKSIPQASCKAAPQIPVESALQPPVVAIPQVNLIDIFDISATSPAGFSTDLDTQTASQSKPQTFLSFPQAPQPFKTDPRSLTAVPVIPLATSKSIPVVTTPIDSFKTAPARREDPRSSMSTVKPQHHAHPFQSVRSTTPISQMKTEARGMAAMPAMRGLPHAYYNSRGSVGTVGPSRPSMMTNPASMQCYPGMMMSQMRPQKPR